MKSISKSLLLLLANVSALSAGTPTESTITTPPADDDGWQFRSALYGWGQAFNGEVGIRGLEADVNIDFKDILEDLNFAAMGVFEISKGRWSLLADLNYAEVGDSVSPLPATPNLIVDYEQKQFLGNFLAIYQVIGNPEMKLDVFGGARVNWIDFELSAGPGITKDETWVDPVIGARFEAPLPNDFFFRALGDIGGFGAASHFTWQALAGFGWRFSDSGALLLGYRALGTDYQDGNFSYDMTTHGPVLGVEFKF